MQIKLHTIDFILLGLLTFFHSVSFSQVKKLPGNTHFKKVIIKGQCIDKVTDLGINEKMVILIFDSTGKINIDNFVSDNDGHFFCVAPYHSKLLITFSAINYSRKDTLLELYRKDTITLGKILLSPLVKELTPVSVTGRKKIVELSYNKIIYNPRADYLNKGINTFDMLQKVPLIDIGNNNQIYVANSTSFVLLINGKEKGILFQNPSAYLKTLPADLVKSVEISITPPAKYTSEGIKYVINIVAEQKLVDGIYGNIGGGISSKQQDADVFLLFKRKKLGVQINSNYNRFSFPDMSSSYHLNIKDYFFSNQNSTFKSVNRVFTPGISLTYDADTTLVINGDLFGTLGNNFNTTTTFVNNIFNLNESDLLRKTKYSQDNGFIYYSMNVEKNLNPEKDLLSFSYQGYYAPGNNSLNAQILRQPATDSSIYFNKGKAHLNESTFQGEYIKNFSSTKILSTGIKGIARDINSYNNFNDEADTASKYSQKIISFFSDFSFTSKKYRVQFGFNLTSSKFQNFTGTSLKNYQKKFFNFFPNLSISKKLPKNQFLSLRISDYVKRPGLNQVNITSNLQNPESQEQGNILLKQEIDYNATLEYSKLINYEPLITSIFTNYSNNQIIAQKSILTDSILRMSYSNKGRLTEYGNTFSYRFKILKDLNLRLNTTISYLKITNNKNSSQKKSIFNYSLSPTITFKIPGNIFFAFRNYFYSKVITFQGYSSGYWDSRVSFSRHFLNNSLSIESIIYNPFQRVQKVKNYYSGDFFSESSTVLTPLRYIGININYEFGNYMKASFRNNKIKIKNTDLK